METLKAIGTIILGLLFYIICTVISLLPIVAVVWIILKLANVI